MTHRLSKSRFQTGLQCPKALWLTCNRRDLADPVGEGQQHIFDTGTSVGELARERFAGGVLVEEGYTQTAEALARTQALLGDPAGPPPAIFEAAFEHGGVFVRPDVLVRVGDGLWDLYEVKSSTKLKPENVTDVAVQLWVLEGAELKIRRANLMHLDNTYVYDGIEYDLERLFVAEDITDDARAYAEQVPSLVASMLEMVEGPEPQLRIGRHCDAPYTCGFYGYCHAFLPGRSVTQLPRITAELLDSLIADEIYAVEDVPVDYPGLSRAQRDACEAAKSGEVRFVGDLARSLSEMRAPLYFLDFETCMSALPLYAGVRPWQQVPFQWSLHKDDGDGGLEHFGFLHEQTTDPRGDFISTLLQALGDSGSIVVYSSFENRILNELAAAFPERADDIARVQARLFDLLQTVRAHVIHPDCVGSASIKVVLPALVPELSYEGLEICEGGTASLRYWQFATGQMAADEAATMFAALREYCGLDTLAMVRVYQALQAAASERVRPDPDVPAVPERPTSPRAPGGA